MVDESRLSAADYEQMIVQQRQRRQMKMQLKPMHWRFGQHSTRCGYWEHPSQPFNDIAEHPSKVSCLRCLRSMLASAKERERGG